MSSSSAVLAEAQAKYAKAPKVEERADLEKVDEGDALAALAAEGSHEFGADKHVSFTSANPGGGATNTDGGVMSGMRSLWDWSADAGQRYGSDVTGYRIQDAPDRQVKTPGWMEHKNIAIDGSLLTMEEKGENWFENKYAVEFAKANVTMLKKGDKDILERNPTYGAFLYTMHTWGILKSREEHWDDLKTEVTKEAKTFEEELQEQKREKARKQEMMTWSKFADALGGDQPLGTVIAEYEANCRAAYSVDGFLDLWGTLLSYMFCFGAIWGTGQGLSKGNKVLMVDAQFMKAAGAGPTTFLVANIVSGAIAWGIQFTGWMGLFILGDKAATRLKLHMYPDEVARQRSNLNYSMGCAFTGASLGFTPYYMLGDVRYALRIATTGAFAGACLGWYIGRTLHRSKSYNMRSVKYTTGELKTYIATMQREALIYDLKCAKANKQERWEEDSEAA